jgi:hypothetical protein
MRSVFAPLAAAAALVFAPYGFAQEPVPPAPPPAQPPAPDVGQQAATAVSDEDLETFADIYVALEATLSEYEEALAAAETQEEAQETQAKLQQDAFQKIADHGWTPDEYSRVVQAVNTDPALREKAVALIEDRS